MTQAVACAYRPATKIACCLICSDSDQAERVKDVPPRRCRSRIAGILPASVHNGYQYLAKNPNRYYGIRRSSTRQFPRKLRLAIDRQQ
jgi:hypothetical protein